MTKKECRDYVSGCIASKIRTIIPNKAEVLSVDIDDKGDIIGVNVKIEKTKGYYFFRGRFYGSNVINGAFNKQIQKHLNKRWEDEE